MSWLARLFHRAEADEVERGTAVLEAQAAAEDDRGRRAEALRAELDSTAPEYWEAVERRAQG